MAAGIAPGFKFACPVNGFYGILSIMNLPQWKDGGTVLPSANRGILIAIEGIDGAGKTTQVDLLTQALIRAGQDPVRSKEPTDGPWGQKIKESASNGRMSLSDELEAFVNDRHQHVASRVQPALDAGKIVILDRYFYSTIAYQGARGADVATIQKLMESRFPIPDIVFLLDVDPELSLFRISHERREEPNQFEKSGPLSTARQIFNSLADPVIKKIDGAGPIPAVHQEILAAFIDGPLKAKRCAKAYGCDDPLHCSPRFGGTCEWWNLARVLRAVELPAAVA